jgi:anti-sigma factor RsiW
MTRSMFSDDPILLVNAYLDGELDPANALAIEQRMAADSAFAAEYTRIGALQRLLRERLPREAAPPGLRARIEVNRPRAQPSWPALAASIAVTAMVSRAARPGSHSRLSRQIPSAMPSSPPTSAR